MGQKQSYNKLSPLIQSSKSNSENKREELGCNHKIKYDDKTIHICGKHITPVHKCGNYSYINNKLYIIKGVKFIYNKDAFNNKKHIAIFGDFEDCEHKCIGKFINGDYTDYGTFIWNSNIQSYLLQGLGERRLSTNNTLIQKGNYVDGILVSKNIASDDITSPPGGPSLI